MKANPLNISVTLYLPWNSGWRRSATVSSKDMFHHPPTHEEIDFGLGANHIGVKGDNLIPFGRFPDRSRASVYDRCGIAQEAVRILA